MTNQSVTELDVQRLLDEISLEIPDLSVYESKPWWLKVVFGIPGIKKLEWNNYTQTIGSTLYLANDWKSYSSAGKYMVLRHELAHLRQFKKYTLIGMALLYLFVFFPIGLAYFRAKFEREGLKEGLIARVRFFGSSDSIKSSSLDSYKKTLTSVAYLWAWPFKKTITKWFEEDWAEALRQ